MAGRRLHQQMHDDLRARIRLAAGRNTAPTAAIIDSQPVKGLTCDTVGGLGG